MSSAAAYTLRPTPSSPPRGRDMIGGHALPRRRSAADGELLHDTTSCAMCRRMIINSGITRVVNRIGDDGIEIIDVQNWIVNDESIQPKAEAE